MSFFDTWPHIHCGKITRFILHTFSILFISPDQIATWSAPLAEAAEVSISRVHEHLVELLGDDGLDDVPGTRRALKIQLAVFIGCAGAVVHGL